MVEEAPVEEPEPEAAAADDPVEEEPAPEEAEEAAPEDDVIRGCVAEVVDSPEEIVHKIADLARECAENIAKALGGTVMDMSTIIVDDEEPKEQK